MRRRSTSVSSTPRSLAAIWPASSACSAVPAELAGQVAELAQPVAIPNDPSLSGAEIDLQAFLFAPPASLRLSNLLSKVIP